MNIQGITIHSTLQTERETTILLHKAWADRGQPTPQLQTPAACYYGPSIGSCRHSREPPDPEDIYYVGYYGTVRGILTIPLLTTYCAGLEYTGYILAEEHNLRDRLYCTVHKVPRNVPRQDHCVCQTGSRAVTDGDHTVLSDPSITLGCHTVLLCQKCSQSVPKCLFVYIFFHRFGQTAEHCRGTAAVRGHV